MELINIAIIALFALFVWSRLKPVQGVKHVTTVELKEIIKERDKQLVDVRTPNEYKSHHISGFTNIPLNELRERAEKQLSKDQEVIVICQSGMRSQQASKVLKKLGYQHVTNVKGGMGAWS